MSISTSSALFSAHISLLISVPVAGFTPLWEDQAAAADAGEVRPHTPSTWVQSRSRRALDFTVAAFALILLSPVLLLCWICVRCSSRGPAIFRQGRVGRFGREFNLYKFRSMRVHSRGPRSMHTVLGDRRITPLGAVLRRVKLDELPQFWNVLKGDMSLVGPRPKLAGHEALYLPYRPGLTGHATLAFRNEECMLRFVHPDQVDLFYDLIVKPIKAGLDREYMENASLRSDLGLLRRTFSRCIDCASDPQQEILMLVQRYAPEHEALLNQELRAHSFQSYDEEEELANFQPNLNEPVSWEPGQRP